MTDNPDDAKRNALNTTLAGRLTTANLAVASTQAEATLAKSQLELNNLKQGSPGPTDMPVAPSGPPEPPPEQPPPPDMGMVRSRLAELRKLATEGLSPADRTNMLADAVRARGAQMRAARAGIKPNGKAH